jgi:VCBS repeat-containing protein
MFANPFRNRPQFAELASSQKRRRLFVKRRLRAELLEDRCLLAVLFSHGAEDPVRVLAPSESEYDDFGLDWTGSVETFDDSAWGGTSGAPNGVGYDRGEGYDALLGVDVEASMHGISPTLFVRAAFDVDDPAVVDRLLLNLRYDDGYIVWLNGTEVARKNAATSYPAWSDTATSEHQASTTAFDSIDLADAIANLRTGANLLAIRGFNVSADDDDALIQFTFVGERRTGPPLAVDDAAATLENAAVTVNVLVNDQEGSDAIDPTSVTIATPPAHGTAVVNANGTITYTPDAAYFGEDSFAYAVRDNTGAGQTTQQTLVASNAAVRVMVPANDNLGTTWRGAAAFNDGAWTAGNFGVGYDTNPSGVNFNPFLRTNVQSAIQNINTSIYMRTPFMLADRNDVVGLTLRMRYDDGFAAFINGVRVTSAYAPDTLFYNSTAIGNTNGDSNAVVFQNFDLTPFLSALRTGNNILAIQGLNQSLGSSDLLMQPELIATIATSGQISNVATVTVNVENVDHVPVARDDDYFAEAGETLVVSTVTFQPGQVHWSDTAGGNGHVYQRIEQSRTWDIARDAAQQLRIGQSTGHLATITSQAEFDFLSSVFPAQGTWLGGYQDLTAADYSEPSGGWRWITGEPWNFTVWSTPANGGNDVEPNNAGPEHVLAIEGGSIGGRTALTWNDFPQNTSLPYLVEFASGTGGVLGNDTDADLDVLTASLVTGPTNGMLALAPDGTFSYTPNAGFVGVDTFTYRANDGGLDSDLATVTIRVGLPTSDFGDAPLPYPTTEAENGARHEAIGPRLGATRSTEGDVEHTAAADGAADDDGVSFGAVRVGQLGATATIDVQSAPLGARLDAWIDFNADGSWGGPGEQIASGKPVAEGANTIRFDVPSWAVDGQTFARFRLSTVGNLGIRGPAVDGEVEDYAVAIFTPGVAQGVFGDQKTISVQAGGASNVFAADMDRDGDLDVVSASENDDSIAWYENDSYQGFTAHIISSTADGARSVFAVDLDGDGDVDIVSALTRDSTIAWYENNGSQSFTERNISTTVAEPFSVFVADVDGDGDLDVLSASASDDRIAWYENDGSQAFTQRIITASADGARSVYAADMDGDGDMDVLSAAISQNEDKIAWYENNGNQVFTTHTVSTSVRGPNAVHAADLDGDGDTDVLSASTDDDMIAWYENDGSETFALRVISDSAEGARTVITADIDGDGHLDVLSASDADDRIVWYRNNGSRVFTVHTISAAADNARSVFAGDVDSDGDLDVLSASWNDNRIAWYENENPSCALCADVYSINEDLTLVVHAAGGLLVNDGAQAGEILTASTASPPRHGSLVLTDDGSFTYTPNPNYFGTDTFTYRITSNQREPLDAVVTLTINAVPDAPVAVGEAYSAESGITLRASYTVVVDPTSRDETLVPINATWSYMHPSNGQDPAVSDADFNTTWQLGGAAYNGPTFSQGAAMLGYGTIDYGPIATNIGTPPGGSRYTAYFRGTFEFNEDPDAVTSLTAQILADDGAVVYLNGQRVGLVNMQQDTNGNYFDRSLSTGSESQTFEVVLDPAALVRGTNVLAVSVHNVEPFSTDIGFALRLDARIVSDPYPVGVLVNDFDVDGDALVAELVAPPANGSLTLDGDGTFEYTSNVGFSGVDTFQYRASDGELSSSPVTVTITVASAMNRPPVVVGDTYEVDEDGVLTVDAATGVLANDSDLEQGPLTATAISPPQNGSLTLNADGSFAYTPDANYFGADQFTYRVSDGFLDSAVATVSITVRPRPDAPVAQGDVAATIASQAVTINVLANDMDPDGEALTSVIESQPTNGTATLAANGAIVYMPNPGFIGVDSFTYRARDGVSSSAPATVTITVRDPAALAAGLIGYWPFDGSGADRSGNARDLTLYGGVGFGDGLFGQALQMTGDNSQYAARPVDDAAFDFGGNDFTIQLWVNFNSTSGEQVLIEKFNGGEGPGWTVTKLGGNVIQVYANNSVNSPQQTISVNTWHHTVVRKLGSQLDVYFDGLPLVQSATFSAFSDTSRPLLIGKRNDGDGRNFAVDGRIDEVAIWDRALSNADIAALYNNGVGTMLALCQACADAYGVDEDARLVVNAAVGVLTNDGAQVGETLMAMVATPPSHGSLSLAADGSFTYTPEPNYFGQDSFAYQIVSNLRDPRGAAVTLTVHPRPDVPVARNDVYATVVNQQLDVSESPGSVESTLIPAGAVWKYLDDGSNQGTAWRETDFDDAAWRSGPAELGYGDGDEMTVVHSGTEGAGRGITTYFRRSFTIDNPSLVTMLSIDLKRDDGAVVYLNGVEVVRENMPIGTIEFDTLAPDFASDDGENFITFSDINRGPLVRGLNVIAVEIHQQTATSSDISFDLELTANVTIVQSLLGNDTDADGDSLAAALLAGPYHGTLAFRADGTFTYTPNTGYEGVDQFTYRANDGALDSAQALVTINVGNANLAPQAANDRFVARQGAVLMIAAAGGLLKNDFDANGDELSTTVFAQPTGGTLTLDADGSFVYLPLAGFVGVDSFTYRVADGSGAIGFATATIHIGVKVDPINGIPLAEGDVYAATLGTPLFVLAPGVLVNDVDPEQRALAAVLDRAPWHGAVSLDADGSFTYTPRAGFTGQDTFTYRASDGNTFSLPSTIAVHVAAPNSQGGVAVLVPPGSTSPGSGTTAPPGSTIPGTLRPVGDLTGDGRVDHGDLAVVVRSYGAVTGTPQFAATADFNGDGRITLADAIEVRNLMGTVTQPASASTLIQIAGGGVPGIASIFNRSAVRAARLLDAATVDGVHISRNDAPRVSGTLVVQRVGRSALQATTPAAVDQSILDHEVATPDVTPRRNYRRSQVTEKVHRKGSPIS